jgi:uncharacterized protein
VQGRECRRSRARGARLRTASEDTPLDHPLTLAATLLVVFAATLLHATVGFGTASVAMPLLALAIGVKTAAPLVAFLILTTTLVIASRSWRSVELHATWGLLASSVVGIPIGLLILRSAPEAWLKGVLGVLLIVFSLYNLTRPALRIGEARGWVVLFGFVAGVIGGAFNTNAPPVVLYGALRGWPPARFRATLQSYFFPVGALVWLGHGLGGLWTLRVVTLYAMALPVVAVAIALGNRFNRRLTPGRFDRVLHVALIGFGLLLLL